MTHWILYLTLMWVLVYGWCRSSLMAPIRIPLYAKIQLPQIYCPVCVGFWVSLAITAAFGLPFPFPGIPVAEIAFGAPFGAFYMYILTDVIGAKMDAFDTDIWVPYADTGSMR